MGQHGDSERSPDKAQAVLAVSLQEKEFWMFSPPDVQLPGPSRATRWPLRKAVVGGGGGEGVDPTSVLSTPAAEKSFSPSQRYEPYPRPVPRRSLGEEPPAPPRSPADTHSTAARQAGKATHSGRVSGGRKSPSLPFPSRPPSVRPEARRPSSKRAPSPTLPPSLPSGPQTRCRLPHSPPRPPRPPEAGHKGPPGCELPSRDAIGPRPPQPASQGSARRRRRPPRLVQLLHDSRPPPPKTSPAPGARHSLLGAAGTNHKRARAPASHSQTGWGRDYAAAQRRQRGR